MGRTVGDSRWWRTEVVIRERQQQSRRDMLVDTVTVLTAVLAGGVDASLRQHRGEGTNPQYLQICASDIPPT